MAQDLFAIVLREPVAGESWESTPRFATFIEFYWAENSEHAIEQSQNAHPESEYLCLARVPYVDERR